MLMGKFRALFLFVKKLSEAVAVLLSVGRLILIISRKLPWLSSEIGTWLTIPLYPSILGQAYVLPCPVIQSKRKPSLAKKVECQRMPVLWLSDQLGSSFPEFAVCSPIRVLLSTLRDIDIHHLPLFDLIHPSSAMLSVQMFLVSPLDQRKVWFVSKLGLMVSQTLQLRWTVSTG